MHLFHCLGIIKKFTPLTFYFLLHPSHFSYKKPTSFITHLLLLLLLLLFLLHSNPSLHCFKCVLGVIGDSNVLCRTAPSTNDFKIRSRTLLTTTCSADSDCLYGQCTNNICTTPDLLCPTSAIGIILILSYMEQMF